MLDLHAECPCRIIQGQGTLKSLPVDTLTGSGIVVTTAGLMKRGQLDDLLRRLREAKLSYEVCFAESNPSLSGLAEFQKHFAGLVPSWCTAVGGGSALDSGKVLAAMLAERNREKLLSEVLSGTVVQAHERIPLWCIPTTSGTGAEVTPFATVWDKECQKKRSFAGSELTPDLIVLDPELTVTAPEEVTVNCALDACSHAMESLWNKNATDQSAGYANEALRGFAEALPRLLKEPQDVSAREAMQLSSFWAGMAIRITRTAIAHSISYPVTLHLGVPHGLACSFLLPRIARLVSDRRAWYPKADMAVIERVLEVLSEVDLPSRMGRYGSMEQILEFEDEMMTPGRGDNFVVPALPKDVITRLLQ